MLNTKRNNPIRVLVVEDSTTIRKHLESLIGRDSRLRVAASAASGEEAMRLLHQVSPDVISLDIRLPGMNGFEVTRRVMTERPTPIVVCSASVESSELRITMNALRAGALSVVEKPVGESHAEYETMALRLCNQLAIMSEVKVIRQRSLLQAKAPSPPCKSDAVSVSAGGRHTLIGIVASTGGPNALATILGALPREFPVPIVIVQHIAPSFADGFIDWLGTVCSLNVVKACSGIEPQPDHVYVAPGDAHLRIRSSHLEVWNGPPVCHQRPSGNVLFHSMAQTLGPRALGVLLTGMGEDGAEGLHAVRAAGGYTIAEHQSTAVVYGMPAAAERLNAACDLVRLYDIGGRLTQVSTLPRELAI